MKNLLYYFLTLILITGCAKEALFELNQANSLELRSGVTPTVANGMLHFNTFGDFETFIQDLETQELDTLNLKNAYTALGIDVTADSIPNLTDHPVCLQTEQGFPGFTSARKSEEIVINAALDNGDDIFSIVEDPYLKTALNSSYSVHIGTRILKYYDNGGIAIVLNNNWTEYDSIKSLPFDSVAFTPEVIITSDARANWTRFYEIDSLGNILAEKEYIIDDTIAASPLYCDFSDDLVISQLTNGNIRIDFPYFELFDKYEWTYEGGGKIYGYPYPLIIDCAEMNSGTVTLTLWDVCHECPTGWIRRCVATINFECHCGEKRTKHDIITSKINGQTWKIEASIWVKSKQVGCRMKYLRKYWVGWLPANNQAVQMDITGTYKRNSSTEYCSDVSYTASRGLGGGTYPTSISLTKSDVEDIFREPDKLDSGHKIKVKGTWFGFGVSPNPRLVLD